MNQFRDILVYAEIDDEDCLKQVVQVAAEHGAAITVCEVVEAPPRVQDTRGVIERVSKLRWSRAFARLRRICELFAADLMIDYTVLTGTPFVSITEQVLQQDFDLVVHVSEPLQITSGTGLNATGMHLMRKCPCTVWALHPPSVREQSDVLLAVDRDLADGTTQAEAFAVQLAESALALAQARDGDLHIVYAWMPYGAELLADPVLGLSAGDISHYRNSQRRDNERWFRRVVQRIESLAPDPTRVKSHLVEGEAVSVVQRVVDELAASMLVLGTVGTSANPGVLIGGTTESILARCACSVLALKPPGFVSPLMLGGGNTDE